MKCHRAIKDSDICLQEAWNGTKTCKENAQYCEDRALDMKRCCPETCQLNYTFTASVCSEFADFPKKFNGTCLYPFQTYADECFTGRQSNRVTLCFTSLFNQNQSHNLFNIYKFFAIK